jgi:hypothetical protein
MDERELILQGIRTAVALVNAERLGDEASRTALTHQTLAEGPLPTACLIGALLGFGLAAVEGCARLSGESAESIMQRMGLAMLEAESG